MSDWNFGGAYAETQGELQRQALAQAAEGRAQQSFPLELQHLQAQTRASSAYADITEQKAASERKLAEITSGMKLDDPNVPQSTNLLHLATASLQAGDPTTARQLLLTASQARTSEVREDYYAAMKGKNEADARIKLYNQYAQAVSGVRNQADLDEVNRQFGQMTGEQPPMMTYTPEGVRLLAESALKAGDRIRAQHYEVTEALSRARLGATESYRSQLLGLRREEEADRERHRRATEKNAGKDVGAPSKGERDAAVDLIETEGKAKGLDPASKSAAAFDLASRARAIRRQNPGVDASEAMRRALNEQVAEGFYAVQKATTRFGSDKVTFGAGKTAASPLPLPSDPKQLKKGTFYESSKHGILQFDGKGFKQVKPGVRLALPPPPEDDPEDEQMDDEEE